MKPIKLANVKIGTFKTRKDGSIVLTIESGKIGAQGAAMIHSLLNIEGDIVFSPGGILVAPEELPVEEWQKSPSQLLYNILFTYYNQCVATGATEKTWEDFRIYHMRHIGDSYKKLLQ